MRGSRTLLSMGMSRWMHAVAVVGALSIGAAALPVSAQTESPTEPILLRHKYTPGETLYYDIAQSIKLSMTIVGVAVTSDAEVKIIGGSVKGEEEQTGREEIRILNVEPDGSIVVEDALEDVQQIAGLETHGVLVSPVSYTVRPNGKIVDIDPTFPYAQLITDSTFEMPDKPLAVGDSWSTPFESDEQGMHFRGTSTTTLAAIEATSIGRVGHFRTKMDGEVTGGNFGGLPSGFQAKFTGATHGTGETDWSVDHGRVIGTTLNATIEGTVEVSGQGVPIFGKMTGTLSAHVQALAPESIKVPVVPSDMLITAGKGIGGYTIGQPIAELTTQLGSPTTIPAHGKWPTMLVWPSGLRGFVDAIEPDRLLSLQVGDDRDIRTDKSIGFGSSRGAVLLAHGMTPTRVELTSPDGAHVYALIYNDQGIAFGIATEGPFFVIDEDRMPVNRVVWITVFPPGGAAEIFSHP